MELLKAASIHLDSTELFLFTAETVYSTSDFHCRMFAPLFGVPEDPATGSGAGPFGCYLVQNGISNGDRVIIESPRGNMEAKAHFTEGIARGVVQVPSHWPGKNNVNLLMDNEHCAPMIGSTQLRCQLCRVQEKG